MERITAICSMLHEPPAVNPDAPAHEHEPVRLNSATRFFRGEPVLNWTLRRLTQSERLGNIAVLCWEDQLPPVEEIAEEHHAYVLAKGPRQNIASVEAIAAARRWTDGWRGGLLSTCDFDLGFYAEWIKELAERLDSEAVVLVDPSAGLVDPMIIDGMIAHAIAKPELELCFTQSPPGLGGVLLRPPLLGRLTQARTHPGRFVHYMPEAPTRDPIGTDACAPVPTSVARSTRSFRLDSHRQTVRITRASQDLNGTLASSNAESIVRRLQWSDVPDELPRELVIELNTNRRSAPIFWPGRYLKINRPPMASLDQWSQLLGEASAADDLRLTIGGTGDPLESDLLLPLIELAQSFGIHGIHVQTDLLCESPQRIERLAASGVDVVSVHVPAMTPATYEQIMGVDALTRVLRNVTELVRGRSASMRGAPLITPVFTKCPQNLAEMEIWYDRWLGTLGCAVIQEPGDFAGQIPVSGVADMAPPCRKPCQRISSRLTVLCDGSIVACENNVFARSPIARLGEASLREIWTNRLVSLRADHKAERWESQPLCATCRDWHRA